MRERTARGSSKGVTLRDVARLAGVSTMTVSNVIHDRKNVHDATRRAVLAAVEDLGYLPNVAARELAGAMPTRIGLVYCNPRSAFLSAIFVGALEVTTRLGAELIIRKAAREDLAAAVEAVRGLIRSGANAILLPAPFGEIIGHSDLAAEFGTPFMALAAGETLAGMAAVRTDDYAAFRAVTARLIERGHRRIGIIRGHPGHRSSVNRFAGYEAALAAAGMDIAPELVAQGDFTYASALAATAKLLDLAEPPSAIFASNDVMAAAVVSVAHMRGVVVGEQLAVVGFDDAPIASHVWPALTTVRLPFTEMATLGTERLIRAIRKPGEVADHATSFVAFELIERDSAAIGLG